MIRISTEERLLPAVDPNTESVNIVVPVSFALTVDDRRRLSACTVVVRHVEVAAVMSDEVVDAMVVVAVVDGQASASPVYSMPDDDGRNSLDSSEHCVDIHSVAPQTTTKLVKWVGEGQRSKFSK